MLHLLNVEHRLKFIKYLVGHHGLVLVVCEFLFLFCALVLLADGFEGTAWKAGFTRQWLLMEIS